jgi:hypothetical protein
MVGCYLHFNEKVPPCILSHWLIHSTKRRTSRTSLSYLIFLIKDSVVFHCNKLQLVQLSFGNRSLTYLFGTLHCSPYLENPTTLISDIYANYLFGHTESVVWFHLTRAKSQAEMMVCVPQGFDIGLCENPAMLMLWLTQLAGRPIAIIPWCLKNNHSPWGFCVAYSRSCPLWSLFLVSKSDLYLMTDWWLL